MKVSINSIRAMDRRYQCAGDPAPDGVAALAQKIGAQLGAIEGITDFGSKYADVMIVKIVSVADHPNADRLHVCLINDGDKTPGIQRDEQGFVQVVCGAPNVRPGIMVAWLPPGATVPSTVGKEPFVMEARELRGVLSSGMLASPKELAIGDNHDVILEIGDDVAPGTPFAQHFELVGDQIIDIENKMFTHRPDCFGALGVAREIAGIQHEPFKSPAWYTLQPAFPAIEAAPLKIDVRNEIPELVPRFMVVAMRGVTVQPSPVRIQLELVKAGLRPINNIVDFTNFFMLETGQPLHAYDYDKVMAQDEGADHATLVVRMPKAGETLRLINGKVIEPRSEAMMIATRDKAIGLGGVMGGGDTEVDEHTTNILIECGTFDMYSVRRTSMAHGLFTDASTRFSKGQSPLQNAAVLAKMIDEVRRYAGGTVASDVVDLSQVAGRQWVHPPVSVPADFINTRLGLRLAANEIKQLLENVECAVNVDGDQLTVTAPFWRTDIELKEDVVEEVGRLYGYDHLPLELPVRRIVPAPRDQLLELKAGIRRQLSRLGANEVLTYSFVHGDLLAKAGQDKAQAFQLSNAISPDLQYYRLSLTPSLLDKIHPNVKAGYDVFALFELGLVHHKPTMDEGEPVPLEDAHLSLVFTADAKAAAGDYDGAPYYLARTYLNELLPLDTCSVVPLKDFDFQDDAWARQMCAPYEPSRSAVIVWDNLVWGVVGEFKASVMKALKLPAFTAGFEVGLALMQAQKPAGYTPVPRFPRVEQDLCLKVAATMPYRQVYDLVRSSLEAHKPSQVIANLQPLDIYQREDDSAYKQLTFRLTIASYERTLTDEEVAKLLDAVATEAHKTLGADRV